MGVRFGRRGAGLSSRVTRPYVGAGVRGVATDWSDISCDQVWDS